jgi:DNA (cytosine-5)-methyltransferase 1
MDDERGELFSEFVGLVEEVMPRAFVAENVEGLTDHRNAFALHRILRQLEAAGYRVVGRILRGERLGVPQTRGRLIILGFRDDLELDPIEWYPDDSGPETTIADCVPGVRRFIRRLRDGAEHPQWRDDDLYGSGRAGPTLTASGMGWARAEEIIAETTGGEFRRPTVDDLLRYCTFPPDFDIPGELEQQWARLGNSVPPAMMRAVAERVSAALTSG